MNMVEEDRMIENQLENSNIAKLETHFSRRLNDCDKFKKFKAMMKTRTNKRAANL